jgi:hypothetical protein
MSTKQIYTVIVDAINREWSNKYGDLDVKNPLNYKQFIANKMLNDNISVIVKKSGKTMDIAPFLTRARPYEDLHKDLKDFDKHLDDFDLYIDVKDFVEAIGYTNIKHGIETIMSHIPDERKLKLGSIRKLKRIGGNLIACDVDLTSSTTKNTIYDPRTRYAGEIKPSRSYFNCLCLYDVLRYLSINQKISDESYDVTEHLTHANNIRDFSMTLPYVIAMEVSLHILEVKESQLHDRV